MTGVQTCALPILLVLDACEHVLDIKDVDFDVVTLIEQQLLASAPKIKIIATSRRRLRSNDERVIDLEGLDYPGRTNIVGAKERSPSDYDSVRLFLQIARNRKHDFDVQTALPDVLRICQKVQGMPLAIALAAAQIRFFPCSEIVEELTRSLDLLATEDTLPEPRQRTVRAAFDYAWEQLSQDEQAVFRSLAVFPGNFSLEAARKVADAPLNVLRSLVDWSLLQLDGTRYQLHDLLRQFGGQKLSNSTELDVYQRLIGYYLGFAQNKHTDYAALEPEWANLLAGMRTAHEGHQWQTVIDYAQTLSEPWFTRGRYADAREGLAWANIAAQSVQDQIAMARFIYLKAKACFQQGSYEETEDCLNRAFALFAGHNDLSGIADVYYQQARLAIERSAYQHAEALLAEARAIRQQNADEIGVAETYLLEAWVHYPQYAFDKAGDMGQRALDIYIRGDDKRALVQTYRLLSIIAGEKKAESQARSYFQHALEICEVLQDKHEMAEVFYTLAQVSRRLNNLKESLSYAERAQNLFGQIGDIKNQAHVMLLLSYIHGDGENHQPAYECAMRSYNLYERLGDKWCVVFGLFYAGVSMAALNNMTEAQRLWQLALPIAEQLQHSDLQELIRLLG